MSYQILIFHLILVVFSTGCASGQNPYFNNKNTLGLLGGEGVRQGDIYSVKTAKELQKLLQLVVVHGWVYLLEVVLVSILIRKIKIVNNSQVGANSIKNL